MEEPADVVEEELEVIEVIEDVEDVEVIEVLDREETEFLDGDDEADDETGDGAAQGEPDVEDVLLLEEVDQELVLAVWEPTGEPRVDAALDLLATLDPDDVHQHAAVFDDIHQQLRATLTDLDSASS